MTHVHKVLDGGNFNIQSTKHVRATTFSTLLLASTIFFYNLTAILLIYMRLHFIILTIFSTTIPNQTQLFGLHFSSFLLKDALNKQPNFFVYIWVFFLLDFYTLRVITIEKQNPTQVKCKDQELVLYSDGVDNLYKKKLRTN